MDERTPSFLFDVFRWPEHKELNELCERLWEELPKGGQHRTVDGLKRHLRLFLCNLYVSYYYDKPVAVSLRRDVFARGRYKQLFLTYRIFKRVFDFLNARGMIGHRIGMKPYSSGWYEAAYSFEPVYYPEREHGCVTRIWPSEALRSEFDKLEELLVLKETDSIVMREKIGKKKKFDIPFLESDFTVNLRSDLRLVNEVLSAHYFQYDASSSKYKFPNPWYKNLNKLYDIHYDEPATDDTSTLLLPGTKRTLKRFSPQIRAVFSNGSFEQGGRLYSAIQRGIGNWQSMPSEQRKTILIDRRPVVELDFDAFHIAMLYAVEGKQLPPKPYDPYTAVIPEVPEMRPIIKTLLLTVLNANSEKSAIDAMEDSMDELAREEYVSERDLKLIRAIDEHEPDWGTLIDRLGAAHPDLACYFCSGAGLMLQRLDSEIMREALLYLAWNNIPAIPIHDSAIVATQYESQLRTAMALGYRYVFGEDFTCGISKK